MGATQRVFKYKCKRQHKSSFQYPLGTRFDDHEEIICAECHEPAYLVAVEVVQAKEKSDGKRRT